MKFQLNTNVFYCEGSQTLALVALGGCGVSICGDNQNLTGHRPGQKALGDPATARGWAGWSLPSSLSYSVILGTASQEDIRRKLKAISMIISHVQEQLRISTQQMTEVHNTQSD